MMKELEVIKEFEGHKVMWAPQTMRARGLLCAGSVELLTPILGLPMGYGIVVDRLFYKAPRTVQKFFLLHEVGHIESGHLKELKAEMAKSALSVAETHLKSGLHPMEEAADRYAIDRLSTRELWDTYRAFVDLALLSIIAPGLRDTRIRARIIRKEIWKRITTKKLAVA